MHGSSAFLTVRPEFKYHITVWIQMTIRHPHWPSNLKHSWNRRAKPPKPFPKSNLAPSLFTLGSARPCFRIFSPTTGNVLESQGQGPG
ncbi:hypothetical protein VTO42DRAFT_5676 [Malbranchea cinnamomea]